MLLFKGNLSPLKEKASKPSITGSFEAFCEVPGGF